jgi:hypothetical protein
MPFDVLPLWAVFAVTLVVILPAVEAGYRLGRARRRRSDQEKEAPVGSMVAALLGLLAFLLAFTFGLAASLFQSRRQVLLDEANAIGTAYLRAEFLPEPHRARVRQFLREYVDVRLAAVQEGTVEAGGRRSEELHNQLWSEAVAVAKHDPRSVPVGLFIQALNEVIDLHAKRMMVGLRSRVPPTVWLVFFAVAVLALGAMGYHGGLAGTTRSPAVLAVALTFAVVIWQIADLDRPHEGLLDVSQRPLEDLQRSMQPANP